MEVARLGELPVVGLGGAVRGGVADLDVVHVMPDQELCVADRVCQATHVGDDRAYEAAGGFAGASSGGAYVDLASSQTSASSPAP